MAHVYVEGRGLCRGGGGGGGGGRGRGGGGQYRLKMLMAELSTVILTPWISACWLMSTLKSEAAMLFRTSINTPPLCLPSLSNLKVW